MLITGQEPVYIGVADKKLLRQLTAAPTLRGGWYYSSMGRKVGVPASTSLGTVEDGVVSAYGACYKKDDIVAVQFDADAGTLRFSLNDHDQGVAFDNLAGRTIVPVVALGGRPSYPATQALELVPSIEAPMAVNTFRFDTSLRNEHILLSDDHMEASGTAWGSFALTGGPLTSGVHTFRFKVGLGCQGCVVGAGRCLTVVRCPQITNKAPSGGICVGCVTSSFDITTKNVAAAPGSWGYSSSGKKVRLGTAVEVSRLVALTVRLVGSQNNGTRTFAAYGEPYTTGDMIEMLLDLDNGRVSFSKNGVPQGIAFMELSGVPVTPACCVGGAMFVPRGRMLGRCVSRASRHRCRVCAQAWLHASGGTGAIVDRVFGCNERSDRAIQPLDEAPEVRGWARCCASRSSRRRSPHPVHGAVS